MTNNFNLKKGLQPDAPAACNKAVIGKLLPANKSLYSQDRNEQNDCIIQTDINSEEKSYF